MLAATGCSAGAQGFDPRDPRSPLRLVRAIELPNVKGRIDHMALNSDGTHLFVAENGNGSVDDVDLTIGKVVGRIDGLREPQGVAWLPAQKEIAATTGDGLVTFYRASDRQVVATINLGSDADNVRTDRRNGDLVAGYGTGGLAVIDPASHKVISRVPLPAHPEAFEIIGARAFVNLPGAHEIAVADLDHGRVESARGTGLQFGNYPMAADVKASRIAVAFRTPGTVSVFDMHSEERIFSSPACGDADDVYFRQGQVIVICGSGSVELIDLTALHARFSIATERGARTGLLQTTDGHLFVAVPARKGPAAIWELSFR